MHSMSPQVRVRLADDQHDILSELKDRRGYTWKGLMLEGAAALQNANQLPNGSGRGEDVMYPAHGPEYRILRWDYELVKMRKNGLLTTTMKGEIVERVLNAELNTAVAAASGAQVTTQGQITDGTDVSDEWDLIFRGDADGGETGTDVEDDNVVCAIEVKSDLKKNEIQGSNSINDRVQEIKKLTDAPVFVVGIRHDHTPPVLRQACVADETVGFGALKDKARGVEEMMNEGEFDRLASALERAFESFRT